MSASDTSRNGAESGVLVLKLRFLPGGFGLAVAPRQTSSCEQWAGSASGTDQMFAPDGYQVMQLGAGATVKRRQTDAWEKVSNGNADFRVGRADLCSAIRTSGRRSSRAEGRPTGISRGRS